MWAQGGEAGSQEVAFARGDLVGVEAPRRLGSVALSVRRLGRLGC
jgi:hypothetical protein